MSQNVVKKSPKPEPRLHSFTQLVREIMQTEGLDRPAAVRAAAKRSPKLHQRYLLESNPHAEELLEAKFQQTELPNH